MIAITSGTINHRTISTIRRSYVRRDTATVTSSTDSTEDYYSEKDDYYTVSVWRVEKALKEFKDISICTDILPSLKDTLKIGKMTSQCIAKPWRLNRLIGKREKRIGLKR